MKNYKIEEVTRGDGSVTYLVYSGDREHDVWFLMTKCNTLETSHEYIAKMKSMEIVKTEVIYDC